MIHSRLVLDTGAHSFTPEPIVVSPPLSGQVPLPRLMNYAADLVLIVSGLNSGNLHAIWGHGWRPFAPEWKARFEDSAFAVFYNGRVTDDRPRPGTVRFCHGRILHRRVRAGPGSRRLARGLPARPGRLLAPPGSRHHAPVRPGRVPHRMQRRRGSPRHLPVLRRTRLGPEWFGAWQRDEWCPWILDQARRLIAAPENT